MSSDASFSSMTAGSLNCAPFSACYGCAHLVGIRVGESARIVGFQPVSLEDTVLHAQMCKDKQ